MERVFKTITDETGKTGVFYNADVGDKTKKQLKDVNTSWSEKDFIVTNNIITCGINYEEMDFDYKYLFIAPFNSPRDIIQVSYRARYLSTGIIHVHYMGKMNQISTWLNDVTEMKCPIYANLYKHILIEKKAPIKKSFQLFCSKAHYKQITDEKAIDEKLALEIEQLLIKQDLGYTYESIETITKVDAENIQERCFAQEATMYEKICLKKYYFQKKFLETASEHICGEEETNTMEYIWNNNFFFFFDRLRMVLPKSDSIFHKIKELNQLPTLFPVTVKKTKLNTEIVDLIFQHFSFKSLSKATSHLKLIKEIYNTFFGCKVINTTMDASEHVSYEIDNEIYLLFDFACQYLILDSEINLTYQNKIADEDEGVDI
jgi:hypothetical protein